MSDAKRPDGNDEHRPDGPPVLRGAAAKLLIVGALLGVALVGIAIRLLLGPR